MRMTLPALVRIAAMAGGIAASGAMYPLLSQAPEFEVASVKPNNSLSGNMSLNRVAGGGLDCTNVTLRMLITFAYDIRDHQLTGGPSWIDADRYDIAARLGHDAAAAEPKGYSEAAMDRTRLRMRALLA